MTSVLVTSAKSAIESEMLEPTKDSLGGATLESMLAAGGQVPRSKTLIAWRTGNEKKLIFSLKK